MGIKKERTLELLKKLLKSAIIGLVMGTAIALFSNFLFQDLFDRLEFVSYYMRAKWEHSLRFMSEAEKTDLADCDKGVCLIDIDDRSMQKLGSYWTWDRSYQAKMLNAIAKHHPAAVLYDVLFYSPDDTNHRARMATIMDRSVKDNPTAVLPEKTRKTILSSIDYDEQFVTAIRNAGCVYNGICLNEESEYTGFALSQVKSKMSMAWHDSLNPASTLSFPKGKLNSIAERKNIIDGIFPALARAACGIGHINVMPNEDGILREVPLLYRFGNNKPVYLPLSVRVTATLFGTPNEEIVYEPNKYIDIGTPFKMYKDAAGKLTCSYPNVTPQQIKAICDKSHEIISCATKKGMEITSLCIAHRDSAGGLFIEMGAPGIFPPELTGVLLGSDLSKALDLEPGNELNLGHDVSVNLDSSGNWVIRAPYDQTEWYCSRIDIETLSRLKIEDMSSLRPGEQKLIFHNLSVHYYSRDGSLVSNIPVLRDQTLRDICTMGWDRISTMPKGTRMNFGRPLRIPLQSQNRHIITYFGPKAKTFKTYSFVDIMNDRVQGEFEGKIFIVGSTAPALFDIKAAPHDRNYPAVEVHASLMHSFLSNTFVRRLEAWQDFAIILFISVIIGFISYLFKPLYSGILTVIAAIGYFVAAMTIFGSDHLWIEIARPVIAILSSYTTVMALRYITEEKDRKFLQSTFKQYLSPDLIDIMYKQRRQPKLGGEEGVRTAYFTDIQGFSTFSEKLGSPTRLVELLNEYLTEMTDTLLKHYGTLDKYEGDAIIAFFGAPMPMEDHAYQACLTALDMQKKLAELRKRWKSQGDKWPTIVHDMRMRIGINTGQIVTGNMGSRVRMNYTMMGDAVNLAARLEGASKQYGVFTMISNFTYDMVKTKFVTRLLDKVTVVGKSEPVVLYELLGEKGAIDEQTQKLLTLYQEGLSCYYAQEWDTTIKIMEDADVLEPNRLVTKGNITPSRKIIDACKHLKLNPPGPDWNGVTLLTAK